VDWQAAFTIPQQIHHNHCEGKLTHVFYMFYLVAEYGTTKIDNLEVIYKVYILKSEENQHNDSILEE